MNGNAKLAVVSLVFALGHSSLPAEETGPTPVPLNVRFVNEAGNPVRGITLDEVQVEAGGVPIPVTEVISPDHPFNVGLVLDVSPSTHEIVDVIQAETSRFFHSLPEESEELIITFDKQIYVDCDWTTDRKLIDEAIYELGLHKPGNYSAIYDALAVALEQRFVGRHPRQVMLFFSDGVEIGSEDVKEEESLQVARKAGVPVFVIHSDSRSYYRRLHAPMRDPETLPPLTDPTPTGTSVGGIYMGGGSDRDIAEYKVKREFDKASKFLRSVADSGRGPYLFMGTSGELGRIYETILRDLSQSYTLMIQPKGRKDGQFHRVRVTTTRRGVMALPLNKGYWAF